MCDSYGLILRYDGRSLEVVETSQDISYQALGLDPDGGTPIAVGNRPNESGSDSVVVTSRNGKDFETTVLGEGADQGRLLEDVWVVAKDTAFVVGEGGLVYRFAGRTWSEMDSGTTQLLRAVHGTSATDVFAVGLNGAVVQYGCEHETPSAPSEPAACDWAEVLGARGMGDIDGVWVGDTGLPYVAGSNGVIRFADLDPEPASLWTAEQVAHFIYVQLA